MELQQFVFSGQAIRQEIRGEKQFISLTDCAKLADGRFRLDKMLQSKQFIEYYEVLKSDGQIFPSESLDENNDGKEQGSKFGTQKQDKPPKPNGLLHIQTRFG